MNKFSGYYDVFGKLLNKGDKVLIGKYFDENEDSGIVEFEYGQWVIKGQMIGFTKCPFVLGLEKYNRKFVKVGY